MDARVYRYYVAVVQYKSYGRAARELYMTPQGLQAAIKRLETSVGVSLLDTRTGSIELTEYGRIFYRHARSLVLEHDIMMDEINSLHKRMTGRVVLSVSTGLFNVFPRDAIDKLNATSKTGVHVEVARTMVDYDCESSLLDKVCDFALVNDPVDHALFSSIPLHKDTMFLWVDERSPLAERQSLSSEDLEGLTVACLTPHEFKTSRAIEGILSNLSKGCTVMYADEMIEVLELAIKDKVCALTVRTHANAFAREGYRGIPVQDMRWGFSVAYRSDRGLSSQDREFLDFMKQYASFYC